MRTNQVAENWSRHNRRVRRWLALISSRIFGRLDSRVRAVMVLGGYLRQDR
jgi:hypothetical protein